MSTSSLKTRCPACHTDFQVSAQQLKVAAGKVRCGACLHVFNAREHARPQDATPPAATPARQPEHVVDTAPATSESAVMERPRANRAMKPEQPRMTVEPVEPVSITPASPIKEHDVPPRQETEIRLTSERDQHTDLPTTLRFSPADLADPALPHQPPSPARTGLFALGVVGCLILLCLQLLWFNRLSWSDKAGLRPLYDVGYQLVGTSVPAGSNLAKISNQQIAIQPHDEVMDAIRVSLLLENQADFAQPFPTLRLVFSDLKGRAVAQRTLAPAQYIDTTIFPDGLMPVQQRVQIQLDLMSPSRRAVSYQLELLPHDAKTG